MGWRVWPGPSPLKRCRPEFKALFHRARAGRTFAICQILPNGFSELKNHWLALRSDMLS